MGPRKKATANTVTDSIELFDPYKPDEEPIRACLEQDELRFTLLALEAANKVTLLKSVIGTHGWKVTASQPDNIIYEELKTALITAFGIGSMGQEAKRELPNLLPPMGDVLQTDSRKN